MAKRAEKKMILITPIKRTRVTLTIIGRTPLLANRIPDDAIPIPGAGSGKNTNVTKTAKKVRTPEDIFTECRYKMSNGKDGFPANAIKRAMVRASKHAADKLHMVDANYMFHVMPTHDNAYYPIKYKEVKMCHHWGRNQNAGGALVHIYRAQYNYWEIDVTIDFNGELISVEDVVNLLRAAGEVGIGAFRPEKGGINGQFEVKATKAPKTKRVA